MSRCDGAQRTWGGGALSRSRSYHGLLTREHGDCGCPFPGEVRNGFFRRKHELRHDRFHGGATVGDPSDERWNALIDETDLVKGASLIGRSAMVLASLADLPDVPQSYTHEYIVQGHRPGITTGGGRFYWDGAVARNRHNGGTIISPTVPAYTAQTGLAGYLDGSGKLSRPPLAALSAKSKAMAFASNGSAGCQGNSPPRQRKSFCNKPVRTKALRPTSVTRPCFPGDRSLRSISYRFGPDHRRNQPDCHSPGARYGDDGCPAVHQHGRTEQCVHLRQWNADQWTEERGTQRRRSIWTFHLWLEKVLVQDLTINAFSGDGLAVTGDAGRPSEDVRIDRVLCNFNGRNGFSVINARRATLLNCRATNTNTNGLGASANGPWAAFDIEPNEGSGYFIEDINLIGCSSEGNAGNGLQFTIPNTDSPVSVRVSGFQSRRDGSATQYGAKNGGVGFIYGGASLRKTLCRV